MKVNKEIRQEMETLAPGFVWPDSRPGYGVPEGYFQGLPQQVRQKINTTAGETIPPGLKKQNPYNIPGSYFEHLPQEILRKIKKDTPVARLPRRRRQRYRWASAAVIAVLVALSGLIMFRSDSRRPTIDQQLAGLSDAAIEQYLGTEISLFNTDEIYNELNDDDIQDMTVSHFSDEDIETYLNNQVTDSL